MQSKTFFVLLCFVAFLNLFFFRSVGFFGFHLLLIGAWSFVCALAVTRNNFQKHLPVYVGTGVCLFLSSLVGTSRTNDTVHLILNFNSLFFVSLSIYTLVSIHPHLHSLIELVMHPWLNIKNYIGTSIRLLDMLGKNKATPLIEKDPEPKEESSQWKKLRPIVGGILLATPIAFFLIALFSQADPVFGSLIKNIVGQEFLENMVWRAVISLICFAIGLPLLMMERKQAFVSPLNRLDKWSLVTEYSVVMSIIALIIGAFLIVQWQYIFIPSVSGVNLSQFGIATYSEYVNKGFNQLLGATLFIFGLIWFGLLIIRRKPENQIRFLKSVQFFVLIEFVVVVLSVFRRIWLYQHYHGMSLVRFYGGYFLLFLLAMTVTLFLRHLYNYRYVLIEIGIVAMSIFALSFINVEGYIVSHPPTVNERVDYVYLARMSPDGVDGWKKSYEWTQQSLDKNYSDGSIIEAEDRRQIAYAGIALEQLISRYQEILLDNGTNEEVKQYYQKILQHSLKQNENAWMYLDSIQNSIAEQPNNVSNMQTMNSHRVSLTQRKEKIQQAMQRVEKDEYTYQPPVVNPVTPIKQWFDGEKNGKVTFDPSNCGYWKMCESFMYSDQVPNSFFSIRQPSNKTKTQKRVALDNILMMNFKGNNVYQDVKTTMPIEELLRLQGRYFSLAQRISTQPDTQRDYDADVSFNTPFLKSMNEYMNW